MSNETTVHTTKNSRILARNLAREIHNDELEKVVGVLCTPEDNRTFVNGEPIDFSWDPRNLSRLRR